MLLIPIAAFSYPWSSLLRDDVEPGRPFVRPGFLFGTGDFDPIVAFAVKFRASPAKNT